MAASVRMGCRSRRPSPITSSTSTSIRSWPTSSPTGAPCAPIATTARTQFQSTLPAWGETEPSYGSEYVPDRKAAHRREMETMERNSAVTLENLKEAHAAEIEAREQHLRAEVKQMRVWRVVALALLVILVVICLWFAWDVTGGDRGLIRYGHAAIGSPVRG